MSPSILSSALPLLIFMIAKIFDSTNFNSKAFDLFLPSSKVIFSSSFKKLPFILILLKFLNFIDV